MANILNKERNNSNYTWRQTFIKEDKLNSIEYNIHEMSPEHLQAAAYKCMNKMIELQKKITGWEDLLEKIEEVSEKKGIELKEYDSHYFNARKIAKAMPFEK